VDNKQGTTISEQMETLGLALPKEINRVREVLGQYREIGPAGTLAAMLIERDLRAAEEAVMEGDVVRMIRSLGTLRGITV
jgi:hypothetical protein